MLYGDFFNSNRAEIVKLVILMLLAAEQGQPLFVHETHEKKQKTEASGIGFLAPIRPSIFLGCAFLPTFFR